MSHPQPSTFRPTDGARRSGLALVLIPAALLAAAALWTRLASAQAPAPADLAATQVHLPAMAVAGLPGCETRVEVQNAGTTPAKAILVVWDGKAASACSPDAAGPLKVECTGLIRPGGTWNLGNQQIPIGSASGTLFSVTAASFSELGLPAPGGVDDIAADYLCEQLFFGVVGDADDYRRFKRAFDLGLTYADVPLAAVAGAPLAVQVERRCLPDAAGGTGMGAAYEGVPGTALGRPRADGRHAYAVPLAAADADGRTTRLSIQNAGFDCATVEVWYRPWGDAPDSPCDVRSVKCVTLTIAPGEAEALNPARWCGSPGQTGSVWLESDGPLAAVADTRGPAALASYVAAPGDDGAASAALVAPIAMPPADAHGRRSFRRVHVQNLDADRMAAIRLLAVDTGGDVVATDAREACPRGGTTFNLEALALPPAWTGSVRVEALAAGGGPAVPLPIAAVLDLRGRMADASPADGIQLSAVPAVGGIGRPDGPGIVALPWLRKGRGAGDAAEIMVHNRVTVPGYTDFVMFIFDANGLLDFTCQKLGAGQVEHIDLQRWGFVNTGFNGSAIVSAAFWEHDVFDPAGAHVRNAVGLGAVVMERTAVAASGAAAFAFRRPAGAPPIVSLRALCGSPPLLPTPTPAAPPTRVPPPTPERPPTAAPTVRLALPWASGGAAP